MKLMFIWKNQFCGQGPVAIYSITMGRMRRVSARIFLQFILLLSRRSTHSALQCFDIINGVNGLTSEGFACLSIDHQILPILCKNNNHSSKLNPSFSRIVGMTPYARKVSYFLYRNGVTTAFSNFLLLAHCLDWRFSGCESRKKKKTERTNAAKKSSILQQHNKNEKSKEFHLTSSGGGGTSQRGRNWGEEEEKKNLSYTHEKKTKWNKK